MQGRISPILGANVQIQSFTYVFMFIKTKPFHLHLKEHCMGFNLINWTPVCGYYVYLLEGSHFEKYGKIWKNGCLSGRLWPDWGNTAWAATAGLGSIPSKHPPVA